MSSKLKELKVGLDIQNFKCARVAPRQTCQDRQMWLALASAGCDSSVSETLGLRAFLPMESTVTLHGLVEPRGRGDTAGLVEPRVFHGTKGPLWH